MSNDLRTDIAKALREHADLLPSGLELAHTMLFDIANAIEAAAPAPTDYVGIPIEAAAHIITRDQNRIALLERDLRAERAQHADAVKTITELHATEVKDLTRRNEDIEAFAKLIAQDRDRCRDALKTMLNAGPLTPEQVDSIRAAAEGRAP